MKFLHHFLKPQSSQIWLNEDQQIFLVMIADPLPLSAEEINHVIINLENHQFHTVPSKFPSPPSCNSGLWNDPKWPKMTLRLINLSGDAWACACQVWWTVECADWEKEIDQWMIITSQKRIWIRHLWINLISLATSSGCFLFQVQHLESTKIWRWFDLSWPPFDPLPPKIIF